MDRLAEFQYAYTHGPLDTEAELRSDFSTGNCRRAVQDFLYKRSGVFLLPSQIYIPESYHTQGEFIIREGEDFSHAPLSAGDVLYAQKIRSKSGRVLETGPELFDSRDEWLFGLHNAVYLGDLDDELLRLLPVDTVRTKGVRYVWHATVVAGGTCVWDWDTFARFYRLVSAKRLVS